MNQNALLTLKFFIIKRYLFILAASLILLASCGTTYSTTSDYRGYDVPASVRTSFSTQYPAATSVTWISNDQVAYPVDRTFLEWPAYNGDYVVRFNLDGSQYYGWFDANGNWIGSTSALADLTTIPTTITTRIGTDYNGYTISSVNRVYRGDVLTYNVALSRDNSTSYLLFDRDGNLIRSTIVTR